MALVDRLTGLFSDDTTYRCTRCGQTLSEKVSTCPSEHCGAPVERVGE
jgi:DNA-directed RNA polymerase subunit RPC12/RpoP